MGALSAEPAEEPADKGEDQEPMDLDLEQMFEVRFMIRLGLQRVPPASRSSIITARVTAVLDSCSTQPTHDHTALIMLSGSSNATAAPIGDTAVLSVMFHNLHMIMTAHVV